MFRGECVSNYLTHLAARSLRVLPTVQPRLHPQFEPAPHAGRLNVTRLFEPLSAESADEATSMENDAHSPQQIIPMHSPTRRQATPTTPVVSSDEGFLVPTPRQKIVMPAAEFSARTATVTDAVATTEVLRSSQPQGHRPRVAPQLHALRPVSSTPEHWTPSASTLHDAQAVKENSTPSRNTTPSNEETLLSSHASPLHTAVNVHPVSKDVARQGEITPAAHPSTYVSPLVPPIAQPQIRPLSIEPRDEGRGRNREAAEPAASTIQVTIGRIEIRAEQTKASTVAKPRGAPPVMSLDDYLRHRSSGGAR